MLRTALLVGLTLLISACSESPPPVGTDASAPDATRDVATEAATDVPAITKDAASDAPSDVLRETAPYTCMPCLFDDQCGPGGSCALIDAMNQPGARMCLLACDAEGASCGQGFAATCQRGHCTPSAGACVPMTSRRNLACPAEGCTGRYALCVDLARTEVVQGRTGQVCLPACARDSDCEDGARRCRIVPTREGAMVRACVPDDRVGPEACGVRAVNPRGVGAPCDAMNPCAAGLSCATGLDPALRGFCTAGCARDEDCGGGDARCLPVPGMGARCLPRDCACASREGETLLDRALAAESAAPWSRCNLYFAHANLDAFPLWLTRDRFRLPAFDRVHRDWRAGVDFARNAGASLDARAATLSGALASAASLAETGDIASHTLPAALPADATEGAFVGAVAEIIAAYGATPDRAALARDAEDLPAALQSALAPVLRASLAAARARDAGMRLGDAPEVRELLFNTAPFITLPTNNALERPDLTDPQQLGAFLGDVRLPTDEALTLARTIEAADLARFRAVMGASFNADTPIGRVVVRDGAAHRYTAEEFPATLLVVDLGGDDTYEAQVAANASAENPVSVLVDLGGADTYAYAERRSSLDTAETLVSDVGGRARNGTGVPSMSRIGRQGSGRLGVALLYDLGAQGDTYRSLRMSQGFGALGIGGLFDDGGDDQYSVEAGGQGAGVLGYGALVDVAGSDRYTVWAFGEGFGYVRGVGLLHDAAGDDVYDSKVTPILYPSPQSMGSNSSFTQGAGFGRRADAVPDRLSMSGGIGVLRDRAGNDRYTTGVFGQGTGYWGAIGMLLDGAGDDAYNARWYVQGGAAHYAYGALVDGGGRDDFNMTSTRENMTAGAGHDFSLGILLALGTESDTYRVPNLALGAGNANGAGIFVEAGGDDTYLARSALTVGNAALETLTDPGRLMRPTVGLFLDGGGDDTYDRMPLGPVGNDRAWAQRIHPEAMLERGLGADGSAPIGLWR